MKKLLFLPLLFLAFESLAQFPGYGFQSSVTTRHEFLGGLQSRKGFINAVYLDTASASAGYIKAYPGALIYVGNDLWLRNSTATAWLKLVSTSSGGAITLGPIGSSPNANAATLTGNVLNLEPASSAFGGVITTGTQSWSGAKSNLGSLYLPNITSGTYSDSLVTVNSSGLLRRMSPSAITGPCDVSITVSADSLSIYICDCHGSCDTVTACAPITAVSSIQFVTDTTYSICTYDTALHSVQCDTCAMPRQNVSIYQNWVTSPSRGILEFGGKNAYGAELGHNTFANTFLYKMTWYGATVEDYIHSFKNYHYTWDGTGIVSFNHRGYGIAGQQDYENVVQLGVNFTSRLYPDTSSRPGYFGYNRLGYFFNTNATGWGPFGLLLDNPNRKLGGVFINADSAYTTEAVSIFGIAPPNSTYVWQPNSLSTQMGDTSFIATFHNNKNITFPGYKSTRDDGAIASGTTKIFYTDASGNLKVGTATFGSGSGTVTGTGAANQVTYWTGTSSITGLALNTSGTTQYLSQTSSGVPTWSTVTVPTSADYWATVGNAVTNGQRIGTTNNRSMRFHTNNTEYMVLDSNGRLGIGVTGPTEILQVTGNVRFSGALMPNNTAGTSGQVLTSAGAGVVPTWATPTTGTVTGSGTINYLSKWSSTTALTISQLFDNGTNVGIGTALPTSKLHIAAGTLTTQQRAIAVTGTLFTGAAGAFESAMDMQITSSNAGNNIFVFNMDLLPGGTDANFYIAGRFVNQAAGTGANLATGYNMGVTGDAIATTSGYNIGSRGRALGGNMNIGVLGLSTTDKNSATNVGGMFWGLNGGTSPTQVGVYAGLNSTAPTLTSAALISDNGTTTSPGLLVRDNGTTFLAAVDGGSVGIGTSAATPAASSLLDLTSTTKGLLIPRMTGAQRTAIGSPAQGLLTYQTGVGTTSAEGMYGYIASNWRRFLTDADSSVLAGAAAVVPTWQQVLTAGSTLTTNNTITTGGNTLFFNGGATKFDSLQISNAASGEDFVLRNRIIALGFPVATMQPKTINKNFALNISPTGTPGDFSGNGIAWLHVIDKDVSGGAGTPTAAVVGITTTSVEIGSRTFGGTSKPVNFIVDSDNRITLSTSNTATFNIGKITQSQSLAGDYVGYSLLNTNNAVAESNPIFFIGQSLTSTHGYIRWNNNATDVNWRDPNQFEIIANVGASGGMAIGGIGGGQIQFIGGTGAGGTVSSMTTTGRWALGSASAATAVLHLPASTTAASTASMKIVEGSRQTTPEDGTINYVANNLEFVETSTVYTLAKTLTNTATLNFDLTAVNSEDLTITVTGAVSGDPVSLGLDPASVSADITFFGWVSASNTVTVRCSRVGGGGAVDPASGTFRASVIKY